MMPDCPPQGNGATVPDVALGCRAFGLRAFPTIAGCRVNRTERGAVPAVTLDVVGGAIKTSASPIARSRIRRDAGGIGGTGGPAASPWDNVAAVTCAGVDFVSVGSMTKNVTSLGLSIGLVLDDARAHAAGPRL